MEPQQLKTLLDKKDDVYLMDVREHDEYAYCRLPGANHLPLSEFMANFQEIPKNKRVVVYCHHGIRSQMVVNFLKNKGYLNVHNLNGGIDKWSITVDSRILRY